MPSLLDRVGLGGARAIANARREMLRHQREEQLVAELVAALARHDARTVEPVARTERTSGAAVRTAA